MPPSRYASTCTRLGPAFNAGCSRAITNVGEVTSPRTRSPAPIPCVNVVFPAPSSPLSTIRSPGASCPASEDPSSRIVSASGASNRNVRSGLRSSTFGGSRRISRNPCRSQNRRVFGSSSRATTVRSSKPSAASTAASMSTRAMPRPCAAGATPNRRRYIVVPTGSSTSPPTSSPSRVTSSPPPLPSSRPSDSSVSVSAAAGGSSGGRTSKAARTTASTRVALSGPTRRTSRLTGSPRWPPRPPAAGRARR